VGAERGGETDVHEDGVAMRLRTFLAWSVLPVLVAGLGVALFIAASMDSQPQDVSRLVAATDRVGALEQARGLATSHTTTLLALGALRSVPPELQTLVAGADQLRSQVDRSALLTSLSETQAASATALRKLEARGPVAPEVRRLLSPFPASVVAALRRGDQAFLDPRPDVVAVTWLPDETKAAQGAAAAASRALQEFGDDPPFWRDPAVGLVAGSLFVVVLALWVVGAWRMSASTRATRAELDDQRARSTRLQERNADLRSLIGVARRVTAEHGLAPFARALAAELRELVGGDVVTVMLLRDGRLEPFGEPGRIDTRPLVLGQGIAGRCAETAAVIRSVVPSDPMLPAETGPLSILSAPLVSDGRVLGVIVAVTCSDESYDDNHETVFQLIALIGATALQAAERYDSTVALTLDDPLTGLANRRCLEHDLQTLDTHGHSAAPVGFAMVDIDHFKSFNDVHGHPEGDAILRRVARAISNAVRDDDVVYRFGGEEFSVLLRDADTDTAASVAERIRQAVRRVAPPLGADPITVSVGVSVQASPPDVDALLAEADGALYEAKRKGRDRVVVTERPGKVWYRTA
jgi:diguanylate cyclase (GGDEF)-like protein